MEKSRTLTMRAFESCSGAGQNFILNSISANVIGTR